jgi:phosphate:Na+ symporter
VRPQADEVEAPRTISEHLAAPPASPGADATSAAAAAFTEEALGRLERSAAQLEEMRRSYRSATLGAVADGTLSADAAILRVETVRSLQALAYHAWRSAAHLVGRGG